MHHMPRPGLTERTHYDALNPGGCSGTNCVQRKSFVVRNGGAVERSYPKRYGGECIVRYLGEISSSLGAEVGNLTVEGELGAEEAELVLVDDLSLTGRGTAETYGTRADVVYVDDTRGTARIYGPICGARHGDSGAAGDLAPPLPLSVLLWRGGVSAGTWVLVTTWTGDGYEGRLIRTTPEVLESGRRLALDLEWCAA